MPASTTPGAAALQAASSGDADRLRGLLADGVATETSGEDGSTLLIHAAAGGHEGCVELLLRAGADADARNREGISPLFIACYNQAPTSLVGQLLAWGADPDAALPDRSTPLSAAAWRGSVEAVRLMLDSGATSIAQAVITAKEANGEEIFGLLIRKMDERREREDSTASVFLSYRRSDTGSWIGRLHRALRQELGHSSVFLDQAGGLDFEEWTPALQRGLTASDVLLAVIGPNWADEAGRKRLDDPDDVVRREIEWFLKTHQDHGTALPVLLGGTPVPSTSGLPDSIRPLFDVQAHRVDFMTWPADVAHLAAGIRRLLDRSADDLLSILQKEAAQPGNPDISIMPLVAGDQFRDMPLVGRWEVLITGPSASPGEPRRETTLVLDLAEDYLFRGEQRHPGSAPVRLDGRWSVRLWDQGGLLLSLDLVEDGRRRAHWNIPAALRRGQGYFAEAADGSTYWWESRGGRSLESVESL